MSSHVVCLSGYMLLFISLSLNQVFQFDIRMARLLPVPEKYSIIWVYYFFVSKSPCAFTISFVFLAEIFAQAFFFGQHLHKHDDEENSPHQ